MRAGKDSRTTRTLWSTCAAALLATVLLVGAPSVFARGTGVDKSFGVRGRVLAALPHGTFALTNSVIDHADRMVVAADVGGQLQLLRFLPNGRIDSGFGNGGIVTVAFDFPALLAGVAVDSQDRIIIAGPDGRTFDDPSSTRTYLTRFLPDGRLDSAFANGGLLVTDHPRLSPYLGSAIAVDKFDRIVVVGDAATAGNAQGTFIARIDSNGVEDSGFLANARGLDCCTRMFDVAFDSNQRIIAAGGDGLNDPDADITPVVWRLLPDGHPDPSFATRGRDPLRVRQFDRWAGSVAIDGRGRILLGGGDHYVLARLDQSGALDRSFGHLGRVAIQPHLTGADNVPAGVAVDPNGRPIIAGTVAGLGYKPPGSSNMWFAYTRLRRNGGFDQTLGRRLHKVGFGQPRCRHLCPPARRLSIWGGTPQLDSAGRLVLAGFVKHGARPFAALTRVHLP